MFITLRSSLGLLPARHVQLPAIADVPSDDPALKQVDGHIDFYDYTAKLAMNRFHFMSFIQLVFGAAVPVSQIVWTGITARAAAGIFGSIVVVISALAARFHDAEHYPSYRATSERLKSERFKFSVEIAPYDNPPPGKTALKLLAETAESIAAQERQQWTKTQESGESGQLPVKS
jgi:Protein of unknown function (DUF4231)